MLRAMSEDEIRERDERVQRLYASSNVEDQLVAILMDTRIGGTGEGEDVARAKACAVLEHLGHPARNPPDHG